MRILVTGGGGFLGSHIARRLRERGDDVWVLGRREYSHLVQGICSLKVDLGDRAAAIKACEGFDAVFHAAAVPGIWGDKTEFERSNVDATRHIIEGCQKFGVEKLIFTSSPSVVFRNRDLEGFDESLSYPQHYPGDYPRTKAVAERMVLEANGVRGVLTASLRPHLIWGPGDPHLVPRIIDRARRNKLVQVGEGNNHVDIIFIDNAVEAHIQAFDALKNGSPVSGKSYFVSDGKPVNLWQWINTLLNALGFSRVDRKISFKTAYRMGAILETAYKILNISTEPKMTRFLAAQLAHSHYFNISRAQKDFGYKPVVGPEEGMLRLIDSLKVHLGS